ncbi:MAG: 6-phosphogluconolactonase, partial [Gammaproteobacteria bacterium]|nr:6-phosphogluconolactonase [Gammaproteobacteria bacterium]
LGVRAVDFFIEKANRTIEENGQFHAAISGGNTPRVFYELLHQTPRAQSLRWEKIHLFWVDERCVSVDSSFSNYKLAFDTFLTKVAIPAENIHRIRAEQDDITASAKDYEDQLRKVFGINSGEIPRFDLIVLGMGTEGHTGSLFPNTYASFETHDLVSVVYELDKEYSRITLTYPVLRAANSLVVLVSGKEKADILKAVFTNEPDEVQYPIHFLWPVLDKVTWLVDKDAAKLL